MKKLLPLLLAVLLLMGCGMQTQTPAPTAEPLPPKIDPSKTMNIPEPITYTGSGNATVEFSGLEEKMAPAWVFVVDGNEENKFFTISGHADKPEDTVNFVGALFPYHGAFLDYNPFSGYLSTRTFEIGAYGDWSIAAHSIYSMPACYKGIAYNGSGDAVLIVPEDEVTEITVKGNMGTQNLYGEQVKGHFSVKAYTPKTHELLVNTTEGYTGTIAIENDPYVITITAVGDWSITIN